MAPAHLALTITFMTSLLGLALNRTHFLSSLLCIEAMMLSIFVGMTLWALQLDATNTTAAPIILLAFSVCEASAGLALLVATTRTHGSDQLRNMNLLKC